VFDPCLRRGQLGRPTVPGSGQALPQPLIYCLEVVRRKLGQRLVQCLSSARAEETRAVGSPGALLQPGADAQPGASHTCWKVSIEVAKRECVFFDGKTVRFTVQVLPKSCVLIRIAGHLTS